MSQGKRKWKVYTTTELRDRFQQNKYGEEDSLSAGSVPNLAKRRNSAPPGMIHFPPGTFSSLSPRDQPSRNSTSPSPTRSKSGPSTRTEQRRASLPHILNSPEAPAFTYATNDNGASSIPSIEHYFASLHERPYSNNDATRESIKQEIKQLLCTTPAERQILPSFQSLLQTIQEEKD